MTTNAPLIVAVGNLYPVKDHATLLRAVKLVSNVQVAIAGRGSEEARLRALATDLGIAERVHLLGLIDDVSRLLRAADVFVQSSRSEGMPLALLEAMGTGLPVVATAVGGMVEVIEDQISGLLVPPGNPESLARALRSVLDDPFQAVALGERAREHTAAHYSHAVMTQTYRELYRSMSSDVLRARHPLRRPRE